MYTPINSLSPNVSPISHPEDIQDRPSLWTRITCRTHNIFQGLSERLHSFGTNIKHRIFKRPCYLMETIDESARQRIFSFLPPRDLARIARTSRSLSQDSLSTLLSYFDMTPPPSQRPEALATYHEQLSGRVSIILDIFNESSILTEEEKALFPLSIDDIISDSQRLCTLFDTAYQLSLVDVFQPRNETIPGLSSEETLWNKADAIRAWLNKEGKNITKIPLRSRTKLYQDEGQTTRKGNMTCIPEELFFLSELNILKLNNQNIMSVPEAISNLSYLSILELGNNNVTRLPNELFELFELSKLNVSGNKISMLSARIENLTELIFLRLDENRFTDLPDAICNLRLRTLCLHSNPLTALPNRIDTHTTLALIQLSNDQNALISDTLRQRMTITVSDWSGDPNVVSYHIKPTHQTKQAPPEVSPPPSDSLSLEQWDSLA